MGFIHRLQLLSLSNNYIKELIIYNKLSLSTFYKKNPLLVILIILLIDIINILISDFGRLTEYRYVYLVGKIILVLIFGTVLILTRKHYT